MKIIIGTISGIALGSLVSYLMLKNPAQPSSGPEAKPVVATATADKAKLEKLTTEITQLKAQLASQPTAPSPASEAPAAAPMVKVQTANVAARNERLEQALKKKMESLQEEFAFTPEQAAAVEAHNRAHEEAVLASRMKSPRDPADYHLSLAYRSDLPPAMLSQLSPEQQAIYQKHDLDARADYAENITNGEMGYIAETFKLSREQRDAIFPHLSQLYMEDTQKDFLNVKDLASLSDQKDSDNERRRVFYGQIFTPAQMTKWEALAIDYKANMLKGYGAP